MELEGTQIEETIKKYFDSAVIIDDQLDLVTQRKVEVITPLDNAQLGEINTSVTDMSGIADEEEVEKKPFEELPIETAQVEDQPTETFYKFIEEGIVTFPHKFDIGGDEKQFEHLKPVIENAKMMIIDWNLRNIKSESNQRMGEDTIKLLSDFSNCKRGLKCAVIYTQEECRDVARELSEVFTVKEADGMVFFQKKEDQDSILFGLVFSKKSVKPTEIINKIAKALIENKIITLHFMDCINRLEQGLDVIINQFSLPFEKVLFAQLLTSDINPEELPQFLNDTLLSSLLNESFRATRLNILFPTKKSKIKRAITSNKCTKENLEEMMKTIIVTGGNKEKILRILQNEAFKAKIQTVLDDKESNLFDGISNVISECAKVDFQGIKEDKLAKLTNEMVVLMILLDNFFEESDTFKDSFKKELYNFTKLFKYLEDESSKIETGTILQSTENSEEYIICITPFCDTFRPKGIDNTYKFIVGKKVDKIISADGYKNAYTAVPVSSGRNELVFVRWSFYNVKCLEKETIESKYNKIASMKREYIQSLINKYIAYQSRAGVNEIFYKESSYIESFNGIFHQAT